MIRVCIQCKETYQTYRKSQHFCSQKCHGVASRGSNSPRYKGWLEAHGYRIVMIDGQRKYEHRHVMEEFLGRSLLRSEIVHHKNGCPFDNRIENLELIDGIKDHMIKHKGGFRNETHKECSYCHEIKPRSEFYLIKQRTPRMDPHKPTCRLCGDYRQKQGIAGQNIRTRPRKDRSA